MIFSSWKFVYDAIVTFILLNWKKYTWRSEFLWVSCYMQSWYTLYNVILRIARNLLETRENIKISTHPFYPINLDWFSWGWSKQYSKWPTQKNWVFQFRQFAIFFSKNSGLVLGLVGLIDAKDIDVAQPIWQWGCPT